MEILDCGHPPSKHSSITTGYGLMPDGTKHCYDCCAEIEWLSMIETGKATLYLIGSERESFHERDRTVFTVTDWSGHLQFNAPYWKRGKHNIARTRVDVWFRGPDGFIWHGVQYGKNTEIVHCKRTKEVKWN